MAMTLLCLLVVQLSTPTIRAPRHALPDYYHGLAQASRPLAGPWLELSHLFGTFMSKVILTVIFLSL